MKNVGYIRINVKQVKN